MPAYGAYQLGGVSLAISDVFRETFRDEHREVRNLLFALVDAFTAHDVTTARHIVSAIAEATGPHFRYEEESMYPRLVPIFGEEYVRKLVADHDGAIRNVRELAQLTDHGQIDQAQAERGIELTRQILPHVSDCDGLSIMVETLPQDDVLDILAIREAALEKNLDLLTWAGTVRARHT
ncbi:hemerythrin domain-containing protein [Microbispora catharanthi]|uniref:Hemerythrin domain-containing protein n=1 Tax=Microbispora catharanthi TaxID=1712871 RepID=A0A5N6BLK4_9ACTN|nr:hemerythrin domain-containing protein [Microbispora catharanthi]